MSSADERVEYLVSMLAGDAPLSRELRDEIWLALQHLHDLTKAVPSKKVGRKVNQRTRILAAIANKIQDEDGVLQKVAVRELVSEHEVGKISDAAGRLAREVRDGDVDIRVLPSTVEHFRRTKKRT